MKTFFKNILLLLCTILLFFIGAELALRISYAQTNTDYYRQYHPVLGHSLTPNANYTEADPFQEFTIDYHINSLGLRDREYPLEKPNNTIRILILGDSFTEGFGVQSEETFTKQLEKKLNKDSDYTYEVINAGVLSYSPLLYYLYLTQYGILLHPDIVIVAFDMTDVYGDWLYTLNAEKDKNGKILATTSPLYPKQNILDLHSYFLQWLDDHAHDLLARLRHQQQRPIYTTMLPEPGNLGRDMLLITRENITQQNLPEWNLSLSYLQALQTFTQTQNITFALAIYPWAHQLNGTEWTPGRTFERFTNTTYSHEPFIILRNFSAQNNLTLLDTIPYFQNTTKKPLYYKYDPHFTPLGHEVMANALYRELTNRSLP